MNFGRVLCFILSGAGLIAGAFSAFVNQSVVEFLILGLLFGIPFTMALAAVPRNWFSETNAPIVKSTPWWRKSVDPEYYVFGKTPFGTLTRIDYGVLVAMLAVTIALVPLGVPFLLSSQINLGDDVFMVAYSVLLAAYIWQLRMTSKVGWGLVVFLIFIGIGTSEHFKSMHEAQKFESGLIFLYVGLWSFIRLTIQAILGQKNAEEES